MTSDSLNDVLVHTLRHEAIGIISIELHAIGGVDLPPFETGSHIDLHLPDGIVRSYSLYNSSAERHRYVIGVLNDKTGRGGSKYVHERLRVGSVIKVSMPRNNFPLAEGAAKSVLIAGGIGITPIYAMFNRLQALGKQVDLLYCARSRKEAAFAEELLSNEASVKTHFDADEGGPPNLRTYLSAQPKDAHFYCCGPTAMLDAFEKISVELGLPFVHVERFTPATPAKTSQSSAYTVFLTKSNKTVLVPSGVSLLQAITDAGVACDSACQEGVCGACETTVIEGIPDHRDSVLGEAERSANKTMMVCVSGSRSDRLVLEL
jgi:ferredoxin-NADP reductase